MKQRKYNCQENLFEFHHHLEQITKSHAGHACFSYTAWDYPKSFSFDIWGPHPPNDWLLHRDTKGEGAFKSHFDPLQTLSLDWVEAVWINRQIQCRESACTSPGGMPTQILSTAGFLFLLYTCKHNAKGHEPQWLTAIPGGYGRGNGTSRDKLIDETKSHIRCAKSLGLWSVSVATGFWMTLKLKIRVNFFLFSI